jgi:ribulose-5-phosphate 4-epimerase/fuculose-1-phosphate aldolase
MDMSLVETTMLTAEEAHTQLQALGKAMLANGLAWGSAGNLSARTEPGK